MEKFKEYLQIKGYSSKSIDSIMIAVNYFLQWCEQENINDATEVTHNDVMAYVHYQNTRGVSRKTVAHYVMHTEKYFRFLQSENEVADNPCSNIKIKGIKRKVLHDILKVDELEKLYEDYATETTIEKSEMIKVPPPQHLQNLARKRNKVILGLIVYQAVRSEEILQLQVSDVKLREGKIKIQAARRSNERTLKLESNQLFDMLDYINDTRKQILHHNAMNTQLLFMSINGSIHFKNALALLIKQLQRINDKVKSIDQLRASVIVHWLQQYNLRKVQIMAGHRYVSSTESYKANNMEELKEDIKNYHPF
ncbi:MAG TPA: tyrosine-type recombinase/integrase [Agriterribacter sp.]|nr:tyrosine-type recombinase/integrase [Agriterribacter sp.]HRP30836.1 tyrosine-type recombinase/integrase [Agriterribacter sp.]